MLNSLSSDLSLTRPDADRLKVGIPWQKCDLIHSLLTLLLGRPGM